VLLFPAAQQVAIGSQNTRVVNQGLIGRKNNQHTVSRVAKVSMHNSPKLSLQTYFNSQHKLLLESRMHFQS
jgi:hypothetical protein